MVNEEVKKIVESIELVPVKEIALCSELVHSVCVDCIKNADYDIDKYDPDEVSGEDKVAVYLFIIQYAFRSGLDYIVGDITDPMMLDIENKDLITAMISIGLSFMKSRNIPVSPLTLITEYPLTDAKIPKRYLDLIVTYISIVDGFYSIEKYSGDNRLPLQSMYYTAWYNNNDIDDSLYAMRNIYENILQPAKFNTNEELNKDMLILKILYDRAFLANPGKVVAWMLPNGGDTEVHPLPLSLLCRIYIIHVKSLAESSNDINQIEAHMTGDLSGIDSALIDALSASMNTAINDMEDNKVAKVIRGIHAYLVETLIIGLKDYYLNEDRVDENRKSDE